MDERLYDELLATCEGCNTEYDAESLEDGLCATCRWWDEEAML